MITIVTDFGTLLRLARALSLAEASGNQQEIAVAKKKHDDYRDLCLASDKMMLNCTSGDLSSKR